jgi:hypothetical protein
LGIGSFFLLTLLIYFFWSRESTGSVLLLASAGLGIMPGLYIGWWSRRMQPRLEDTEVEPKDITGVIGQFPENTIFPFTLGIGLWLVGLAFVFGLWFAIIGLGFVFGAAIGATQESKRASFSERENI